ncbi:DUF58 domain-containing protein [Vibrio superstes]|uniref:MoxR protein n=1 Tax=Vibrio superstes NBRC 103154 TaxID=1219062 RepID=A0A511QNW6_9VIBR|nr:DUF58 domain-containing protein [Vibrio superstes]GEM79028.1 MoxR protein [Vibrio superstes NBRC 103154]
MTNLMSVQKLDSRIGTSYQRLMGLREQGRRLCIPSMRKPLSRLSGKNVSAFRGRGMTFEEFREYQLGDDVRAIDWNVSQRTGEPHVRLYSEEKEKPVFICIDQRQSMFFATLETMKSVVAAEVAAALMWSGVKHGERVGALLLSHDSRWFTPKRSSRNVSSILKDLAQINNNLALSPASSMPNETDVFSSLSKLEQQDVKGATIILISDFSGDIEQWKSCIRRLSRRNDVLGISIHDPMEHSFTVEQDLVLGSGEMQVSVGRQHRRALSLYHEQKKSDKQSLTKALQQLNLPIAQLTTSGNHLDELFVQFAHRK